ncbi:uncharacterized protein BDV17DRAFT_265237, partial [Aspergillus undulatus]|uniref:uncharacterized protein n=1 Tax=Aspergillus undulatus TaxID=1810928 RepID=UPI003CCE18AE
MACLLLSGSCRISRSVDGCAGGGAATDSTQSAPLSLAQVAGTTSRMSRTHLRFSLAQAPHVGMTLSMHFFRL